MIFKNKLLVISNISLKKNVNEQRECTLIRTLHNN